MLLCNPVPPSDAIASDEVAVAAREAERLADGAAVFGKSRTPFLLAAMAELTAGKSLEANLVSARRQREGRRGDRGNACPRRPAQFVG